MKFIVSSTFLYKNLQALNGVLPTKSTLPILDNFLFSLTKEGLKIEASDTETTMTVTVMPDMMDGEGKIAVPARKLMEWLRICPDVPVTFTINAEAENYAVELEAGEGRFTLTGFSPEGYPQMNVIDDGNKFNITADKLLSAINRTIFATGSDDNRLVMTGVYCSISEEGIIFVATDAHKLVRYKRSDVKVETPFDLILPKKALQQVKTVLSATDEEVKVICKDNFVIFQYADFVVSCRLIEGKYPNYQAVIPTENPNTMVVHRASLLSAIQRVSVFASQSTNQIRFKISEQELELSAEDLDFSNKGAEKLNCHFSGEEMEIGFNSRFLIEMLRNTDSDEIRFELSRPSRAGLIIPVESSDEHVDILMLVMPLMLNN